MLKIPTEKTNAARHTLFCVLLLCSFIVSAPLAASPLVNINTAPAEELTSLPFIGQTRAQAIISYRRQHGSFYDIDNLQNVHGLGKKSIAAIRPLITLGGTTTASIKPTKPRSPLVEPEAMNIRSGQIMLLPDKSYYPMLLKFIRGARHRIDMVMYIFKKGSGKNNRPSKVALELIKARQRGVKVEVVLDNSDWNEGVNEANRKVARYLRKNKVAVRFESKKKTTHSKVVVVDQRFVFVGSHNMTHSALGKNHEMSLLLDSPKVARQMVRYIERIR